MKKWGHGMQKYIVIFLLALFTFFGFLQILGGVFLFFIFKNVFISIIIMGMGLVFMLITGIPMLIVIKGEIPFIEKAAYGFVLFLGIVMVIGSLVYVTYSVRYVQNAIPVEAEIVSISSYYDEKGTEKHNVYVTYEYDGNIYENVDIHSWSPGMKEGDNITIYHDGQKNGRVRSRMELWGVAGIMFLVGAMFTYGGIYYLRHHKYGV